MTMARSCSSVAAALVLFTVGCSTDRPPQARTSGPPPASAAGAPARNDYDPDDAWLCRPGRQDACAVDLSATRIAADGTLAREEWRINPAAPIDCFYVYPTVSQDPTPFSDMQPGPEERRAVELQFARFGSQCRLFAPVYRQVTLAGLLEAIQAGRMPDWSVPYADVLDAWNHYLRQDNHGRGVVLIGHSQGARLLIRLLRGEIEGKPVQKQIVSALILGANYPSPAGDPSPRLPPCTSPAQTGCIISYVTFRSTSPPPANALFGRGPKGSAFLCTNPAALGGGRAELDAYFPTTGSLLGLGQPYPWLKGGAPVATPFVRVPGLVSGECVTQDGATYLAVSVHADPAAARTDDIPGDLVVNGKVLRDWGLHLVDANVALGNLVDIVGQQARSYVAKRAR